MIYRDIIKIKTEKGPAKINITQKIQDTVEKSKLKEGLCNVYLMATTAGLVINEDEPMLNEDFKRMFRRIEEDKIYQHPSNAFSHLRSLWSATEKTIPISDGKLVLGEWQDILLWEFDTKERDRKIIITINGV